MNRFLTTSLSAALPLLALAAMATPAQAQRYNGQYDAQGTVRCESNDNRQRACTTGWRDAQLVRQLSNAQCIEGRTWGSNNGAVWVSNGCRAEFTAGRGGWANNNFGNSGSIRCESNDNRQRSCNTGWRDAELVRQLSKSQCIEGRTWGSNNGTVWVSNGCRGEFVAGNGRNWNRGRGNHNGYGNNGYGNNGYYGNDTLVTCSSDDNRQRSCNWNQRGRPVLVEQLSNTRCVEGRNWGYSGNQLWVNGGCRARFGSR